MSEVTRILQRIGAGDARSTEQLLPLVYDELRRLAAARLAQEKPGQTLSATSLVHEAYLRLVGSEPLAWGSRGHFFAAAAEAMRRILVDAARAKATAKRGGDAQRIELSHVQPEIAGPDLDILALHEALARLESQDARAAELVKLRFFAGLTIDETAQALSISVTTAKAEWTYAKNWLRAEMLGKP